MPPILERVWRASKKSEGGGMGSIGWGKEEKVM